MSFSSAALALAWFVLALLVLVVAGVVRQVAALSASSARGAAGGVGGVDSLDARRLVGFAIPATGPLAPLRPPGAGVILFSSPTCAACHEVLVDLVTFIPDGELVVASLGDCAGVGGRDLRCLPEAGSLFDQLGVPGAPFLMAVDAHGTITATLMPEGPTHVRDWLRPTIPLHAKEKR